MDFLSNIDFQSFFDTFLQGLYRFGVGLLILLATWIVARVVRGVVRNLLQRTDIDNRFAETMGGNDNGLSIERILSQGVYFLIWLFGIQIFLDHIQVDALTGPFGEMISSITGALPSLLTALGLLLLAYIVATVVRMLIVRGADAANVDKRLSQLDSETQVSGIGESLGTAGFWLVMLLFLPSIISQLGMDSLVTPLNDMLGSFTGFVPNLFAAGLIALVGYFLARIIRQIVTSLMNALDVDRFGRNAGLDLSITNLVGTIIFTFILLLTIVQALDRLGIEAISAPATEMISAIFNALPLLFGAALIIGVLFVIGRLIAGLVESLLQSAGFDDMPQRLGLNLSSMNRTPSQFVGWLVLAGIMLMAVMGASNLMGFTELSSIMQEFIGFGGQLVLGVIVLGIGLWLANLAARLMREAGFSPFATSLVRAAVMVLIGAMALERIGIGEDIVQLAFGIGLGAIGIAAALAFGLGSRDLAGQEVERFVSSMRSESESLPPGD